MSQKSRNIGRNILWGYINKGLLLIIPFVARTILLRIMGTEYLGVNSLFFSILSILNLAELGIDSAVVFNMYKPLAEGDKSTVQALMNFYRKTYKIIGFFVLLIGLGIIPFLHLFVSEGSYPTDINIMTVYLIFLSNTVLTYFVFSYKKAILTANQRNDVLSNVSSIIILTQNVVQILIFYLFRNYYLYILFLPVFTLISNLLNAYFANRIFPQYHPKGKIEKDQLAQIKKQVSGLFINKLAHQTMSSFDTIIISVFIGLTIVTVYTNYYFIIVTVHGIGLVFISSIKAVVGNFIVTESKDENYNKFTIITFIYAVFTIWATSMTIALIQPFMKIWAGEDLLLPISTASILVVFNLLLLLGDVRSLYSEVNGLWWKTKFPYIVQSLLNVILSVLLGKIFGLSGILFATCLSTFIVGQVWLPYILFENYFGISKYKNYMLKNMLYIFVGVIISCISYFISVVIPHNGIISLALISVVISLVTVLLLFLLYSKTEVYKKSKNLVKLFVSQIYNEKHNTKKV